MTTVTAGPTPISSRARREISQDDWQDMVATAAYCRAEKRGFEPGSAEEDWFEAEAELRERLASPMVE